MNSYETIIIGAGHNGLVAAAELGKAGQRVLVLERLGAPGGSASTIEFAPGYRASLPIGSGIPSGTPLANLLPQPQPEHSPSPTVSLLPGGDSLVLWPDPARTAESLRRFSRSDAEKWPRFVAQLNRFTAVLREAYNATMPNPSSDAGEFLGMFPFAKNLRGLGKKEMMEFIRILPMSVKDFLDDWFESEALKGALGASGITGIRQGPRSAGTTFMFLHNTVVGTGVPPTPHVGATVTGRPWMESLASLVRSRAVAINFNAEVAEIIVSDGRARGVRLAGSGDEYLATRILSSADPRRTFNLVDPLHLDPAFQREVRNIKYRGAVAFAFFALDGLPDFANPELLAGEIRVSPSLDYLERAADAAKYGRISESPYISATIPTLSDPSLAPEGKHVMAALLQFAPYHLCDNAWNDATRDSLGGLAVATLSEFAPNPTGTLRSLQSRISSVSVLTPLDLEARFGLTEGNIHHGEMMLDQILVMRPIPGWAQYRTPIDGLYLCGAGTHPGGGLTGWPGRNAAREVLKGMTR